MPVTIVHTDGGGLAPQRKDEHMSIAFLEGAEYAAATSEETVMTIDYRERYHSADKIDLLRLLLDANEDYNHLLDELHKLAKSDLGSEGGLPLYDKSRALLVMVVKEWLCKLILEKA